MRGVVVLGGGCECNVEKILRIVGIFMVLSSGCEDIVEVLISMMCLGLIGIGD